MIDLSLTQTLNSYWDTCEKPRNRDKKLEEEQPKYCARELDKLLGIKLKRLDFRDGDVLIIHLTKAVPKSELADFLNQLRKLTPITTKKIPIFVVPADATLETVDEKALNEAG